MADVYGAPKRPKMRSRPKARARKKLRRDYKKRRDQIGQYATSDRGVVSRRYIRALRRKTAQKRSPRKTRQNIYNAKGGLKSASAKRAGQRRGSVKNNSQRTRR